MVKICGITRREDAEAAVSAGASAIGFVFYPPSPRYVTPERAAELGEGLPILKVGVFQEEPEESIATIMRTAKLDIAQVYRCHAPRGTRAWAALRVPGGAIGHGRVEALLLDGPANGISFDWSRAKGLAINTIIAGGLDASNVAEAIRIAQPWGVDASSKLESAPGVKDHEKMLRFVEAARNA